MYHILIVDDEQDIINALKIYFASYDLKIYEANNGIDAIEIVKNEEIHLMLLDIMMPQLDGIETMIKIREFSNIPIILLTAKSEDMDIILGLNVGADDYITKPFNPLEVVARVKSVLRRYTTLGSVTVSSDVIVIGGIELNDSSKEVKVDGENISLTPKEYEILKLLMQHPNKVYSPRDIYSIIWDEPVLSGDSSVAVHIRHIREKIEIDPNNPRYLKVVWGQGYKIEGGK